MRYTGINIVSRRGHDSITSRTRTNSILDVVLDVDGVRSFFNYIIKSPVKLSNGIVYVKLKDKHYNSDAAATTCYCKIPEDNPLFNYWMLEWELFEMIFPSIDPIILKQLDEMLK